MTQALTDSKASMPATGLSPLSRVVVAVALSLSALMAQAQTHELNLQDAEIGTLIATVSQLTGKSFIVDPRVEGTVTVISRKAMTPDEIYEVFLSVLKVHGYGAVPNGEFVKIVPDAVAYQDTIPTGDRYSGGGDTLVTQVITVEHVPAAELVALLRPLIPQNGHIVAHPGSNTLVISDRAGNVDRLRQVIRRIDTASEDDIEVIALSHANASEVVRTINLLVEENTAPGGGGARIIADERSNSVMLAGDPGSRLRMKTLITHLDTPLDSGSTQVIYLRYAQADSLVSILEKVADTGSEDGSDQVTTSIQAHPETNALVISAPPAVYRSLESIVRQLDIRRRQVMVEAIIAEVSNDFTKELGVQWQATGVDSLNDSGLVGGTNFPTGLGTGPGLLDFSSGQAGLFSLGALGTGLNLGYLAGTISVQTGTDANGAPIFSEVPQLSAIASALQADVDTNVLSTPSIVTLDHAEAVINVGQEVPFVTGQFTNTGASNSAVNPFQTINRQDVGLTLTVTPHVNEGDTIILEIQQEASSLSPQGGAVDLITNKRELSTTVMVPDQGVLVLGGLIDEDVRETVRKVPALGDIPLLGNLFKYRSTSRVKRNLMIFIRPRILADEATINAVTGSRYNYMRERQTEAREQYRGLLDSDELPLLPDLSEYRDAAKSAGEE